MNNNLLDIVKKITTDQGENILFEPKRVSAIFSDIAQDVPKPQKNAFIKCLEHKFPQALKSVSESERADCKQQLAQKLHEEEGLDLGLCTDALDVLEDVLFGEISKSEPAVKQTQPVVPETSPVVTKTPSQDVSASSTVTQTSVPQSSTPAKKNTVRNVLIVCGIVLLGIIIINMFNNVDRTPEITQGEVNHLLDELIGVWDGSYGANQGETGLTLTVFKSDGNYRARFEFYNLPGRTNSEEGSYYMDVSYEQSKYILKGSEWIVRPGIYVFVDLYGTINGNIFSGSVLYSQGGGGSPFTFSLVRRH